MSEIVARCRSCGFEQSGDELAECPVCCGASAWWCGSCGSWRPERQCPGCASQIAVPAEVVLGTFPAGSRVPFSFKVQNRGKKDLVLSVESLHPALVLRNRTLHVLPSAYVEVSGQINLGQLLPGPRSYRVRFSTETEVETELHVEVVPLIRRLEFVSPEVVFPNALPGATCRRGLLVKNTGNVSVTAILSPSAAWIHATPDRLELAPGESRSVTVSVKTRKSNFGTHTGTLRAAADSSHWDLPVRVELPAPALTADAVDFGDLRPDYAHYRRVVLRNKGSVRIACRFGADHSWLAVAPRRAALLPGEAIELKLRALVPSERAGPVSANVVVSASDAVLFRIPVSGICRNPNPILAPIRKQSVGEIAIDAPTVRRFQVANTGEGALNCTVTADQPWIEIVTRLLRVAPDKKQRVEFRVNAPSLNRGLHRAIIRIESNGGAADVPVTLTVVDPAPKLEVKGDEDLGTIRADQPATGTLAVRNVGVGLLKLRAETDDPHLTVRPTEVTVTPGSTGKLAVTIAIGDLDGGLHRFAVRLSSNGGDGEASVRFRVPIEEIDAVHEIDLGDVPEEHTLTDSLRVGNSGPDSVTLKIRAAHSWIHLAEDRVVVKPDEVAAVPFRVALADGIHGPVKSTVWLEGRKLRHAIIVRAVAKKIDLVVIPSILMLGRMRPGAERSITLQVVNGGEMTADICETHVHGGLEVWLHRQIVEPGETARVMARVRMNSRAIGQEVLAPVPLANQASVLFSATVARSKMPWFVAGLAVIGGVAGGVLASTGRWDAGWGVALLTLFAGFALLVRNRATR